jgi:hypothetical protein
VKLRVFSWHTGPARFLGPDANGKTPSGSTRQSHQSACCACCVKGGSSTVSAFITETAGCSLSGLNLDAFTVTAMHGIVFQRHPVVPLAMSASPLAAGGASVSRCCAYCSVHPTTSTRALGRSRPVITEMRILIMAAKLGPNVLFCMPDGTKCIPLVSAMCESVLTSWRGGEVQLSYSACRIGPTVSCWIPVMCASVLTAPRGGEVHLIAAVVCQVRPDTKPSSPASLSASLCASFWRGVFLCFFGRPKAPVAKAVCVGCLLQEGQELQSRHGPRGPLQRPFR